VADQAIYEELTGIFRDIFMRDDLVLIAGTSALDVPGWDSFKQIEIILAVEGQFGIRFNTRELDALHNVGDLAGTILAKTGGAAAGDR
jgi:acyl carrier protein